MNIDMMQVRPLAQAMPQEWASAPFANTRAEERQGREDYLAGVFCDTGRSPAYVCAWYEASATAGQMR